MDNKSSFDRSLWIPIAVGIFSLVGICIVLMFSRLGSFRSVPTTATETPFKYTYLGTEPGVNTDVPLGTQIITESPAPAADVPFFTATAFSISTLGVTSSPIPGVPSTTKTASTPTLSAPILPFYGTYDDTDIWFLYQGDWDLQGGVKGVYRNSLHVSRSLGDSVSFSFVGQKLRFLYQAGPSLGTVTIRVDTLDFTLEQSDATTKTGEWESVDLINAVHSITITHTGGGSINIDSVIIIDLTTPTPTSTPTSTATP